MYLNNMFALNQNSHSNKHISLIQPKFNTKNIWFEPVYVTKEVVCGIN